MTGEATTAFRRYRHALGEALRDAISLVRAAVRRHARAAPQRPGRPPRILIFDELLPDPRFGAGFPRAAEMLQAIVDAGWHATVYPMKAFAEDYAAVRARFPVGVAFLRGTDARGMRRVMQENVDTFDAVLISRPTVMTRFARICATLPTFAARNHCIYDAEAMFTARDALRLALFETPMSKAAYDAALAEEVAAIGDARAVISVTEAEARLFRERTSVPVHVIGHTTPVRHDPPGFEARADFLFVGKSVGERAYSPNVDSLLWFVEEVMPLLDGLIGTDYGLVIAGLADEALTRRLASPRITFAGVVDDLAPWYDRSRVFIAPTRFAAGVPLKVVEAAAAGVPCVVTDLIATQLRFVDGIECRSAVDARTFADACAALYDDRETWTGVRDRALARVSRDYSRQAFDDAVRRVLDDALSSSAPAIGDEDSAIVAPDARRDRMSG